MSGASFVGAALAGLIAAIPRPAAAWDSSEHSAIARSGHVLACKTLLKAAPDQKGAAIYREVCPDAISAIREDACHSIPGGASLGAAIPAYAPGSDDFPYWVSEGAALAGDYLRSPQDFDAISAERSFSTVYQYLFLANDNDDHFHPRVVTLMLQELGAARALARQAHVEPSAPRRHELLHTAGTHLAFALHFGQDAFAAGHMGFNRAGSSAGPSQRLHAVFNAVGRDVVNHQGHEFLVFGDGHYCEMGSDARFMVVATSASMLLEVFADYALDAGRADGLLAALDVDPLKYVPASALTAQALAYSSALRWLPLPHVASIPQVSYNFPPEQTSLSTVGGTARQSVSLGAGGLYTRSGHAFFGLAGMYIKGGENEAPIDWGFAGGVFGSPSGIYRVESGIGSRIGFIGSGLLTIEPCVLFAYEGGVGSDTRHDLFASPRLQALLELGQVAFLRASGGYDIGIKDAPSGFVVGANLGLLIGAFGGGPLDLRNVSRGF